MTGIKKLKGVHQTVYSLIFYSNIIKKKEMRHY